MLKKMTCCLMACVGLSAFGAEWILNMNPSGNTEILSEVYYLNVGGNGMLPEECLTFAMAEA